ncbi:MAG: GNAT family N-acetyltransferase [Ilumatobacteraceae bacterium]
MALAAFEHGRIVATLHSFPTELTMPGGNTVSAGALTAVTCQPTHRRQGVLTRMIGADLLASKERGEPVDILIAAEYPIYGRFGYGPAVRDGMGARSRRDPIRRTGNRKRRVRRRRDVPQGGADDLRARPHHTSRHDRSQRLRLGRQGRSPSPSRGQAVARFPSALS